MSRERFSLAALLLLCGALPPALAEKPSSLPKILWEYPCEFSFFDEKAGKVMYYINSYRCDFIHAKYDQTTADRFNDYKPEDQHAEFDTMFYLADKAYEKYESSIEPILTKTDPANLPKEQTSQGRLKALMEFKKTLMDSIFYSSPTATARPFLWEHYKDSYAEDSKMPDSWKPYLAPFDKRWDELDELIKPQQAAVLKETDTRLQAGLAVTQYATRLWERYKSIHASHETSKEALDKAYDNLGDGGRQGGIDVEDVRGKPKPSLPPGLHPQHHFHIEPREPPPTIKGEPGRPISGADSTKIGIQSPQRNYFRRGYSEGMQRLLDDQKIALWHSLGWTETIGAPDFKEVLTLQQKGGSCAIGAQCEAMLARGKGVAMPELVMEAKAAHIYSELATKASGLVGGTEWDDTAKLLNRHDIPTASKRNVTLEDLNEALRKSQHNDAIVGLDAKPLWNDEFLPVHAAHMVYVSGMEVDKRSGNTLGYYINDTGTGEGGRYVPKEAFQRAMDGLGADNQLISLLDTDKGLPPTGQSISPR